MTWIEPFAYPTAPYVRCHAPAGYSPYGSFKPWLRDEFLFRCVYCLEREEWYPDKSDSFSVDHVIPQSEAPHLICEYANLVYACTRCNSARQDVRVLDPTEVALGEHIRLGDDGFLIGLTAEGKDLIDLLRLNTGPALQVRRRYLHCLQIAKKLPDDPDIRTQYHDYFGYPADLPDLRILRPPGNRSPKSVHSCHYARRERGELPAVY